MAKCKTISLNFEQKVFLYFSSYFLIVLVRLHNGVPWHTQTQEVPGTEWEHPNVAHVGGALGQGGL